MADKDISQLLQHVFDFTDEDVVANKYGQLSPRQTKFYAPYTFEKSQPSALPLSLLFLVLMGTIIGVLAGERIMLALAFCVGGLIALLINEAVIKPRFGGKHKRTPQVNEICGMVIQGAEVQTTPYDKPQYCIDIVYQEHEARFTVTSQQFFALENGGYYCVYYYPETMKILAVTPTTRSELYVEAYAPKDRLGANSLRHGQ